MLKISLFFLISFLYLTNLHAYIGPGMGGGMIAAIFGIIIAIIAGFFGIIWFPIKRFLKSRKKNNNKNKEI